DFGADELSDGLRLCFGKRIRPSRVGIVRSNTGDALGLGEEIGRNIASRPYPIGAAIITHEAVHDSHPTAPLVVPAQRLRSFGPRWDLLRRCAARAGYTPQP